jgi:hypothetical protein
MSDLIPYNEQVRNRQMAYEAETGKWARMHGRSDMGWHCACPLDDPDCPRHSWDRQHGIRAQ